MVEPKVLVLDERFSRLVAAGRRMSCSKNSLAVNRSGVRCLASRTRRGLDHRPSGVILVDDAIIDADSPPRSRATRTSSEFFWRLKTQIPVAQKSTEGIPKSMLKLTTHAPARPALRHYNQRSGRGRLCHPRGSRGAPLQLGVMTVTGAAASTARM